MAKSDRLPNPPSVHDKLKQAGAKPGLINFVDYAFACGVDISQIAINFLKGNPATLYGLKPPESVVQEHEANWMQSVTERLKNKKTGWIAEDLNDLTEMFSSIFKNAPIVNIEETSNSITVYSNRELSNSQIANLREAYNKPVFTKIKEEFV